MTLEVGFLGYSFMGTAHANALARLPMFFPDAPDVNRSVIVGRSEGAVQSAADRLGFDRVETDWTNALDVDVLYNLGPNTVHVEPTVRALENDVHVFCEKPLAPTLDGAREMAAAAESSAAIAGVAFNYRYVPAIQLAKRLIDAGEFGQIRRFHGQYHQGWQADPKDEWRWRNDETVAGSGAVGDVGAHTIDLARFLVGDAERVVGQLETFIEERPTGDGERKPVTTDDEYSALVSFENGAMGVFEGSRVATGRKGENTVELYGSKGGCKFSMERLNELEVHTETTDGFERILVTEDDHPYMDAWWPTGHIIGWEHTFVHENYEFLSAVADEEPYEPGFDAGVAAQRVVDAVQRSHEQGAWMSL